MWVERGLSGSNYSLKIMAGAIIYGRHAFLFNSLPRVAHLIFTFCHLTYYYYLPFNFSGMQNDVPAQPHSMFPTVLQLLEISGDPICNEMFDPLERIADIHV